jgi:hypothetical protein
VDIVERLGIPEAAGRILRKNALVIAIAGTASYNSALKELAHLYLEETRDDGFFVHDMYDPFYDLRTIRGWRHLGHILDHFLRLTKRMQEIPPSPLRERWYWFIRSPFKSFLTNSLRKR